MSASQSAVAVAEDVVDVVVVTPLEEGSGAPISDEPVSPAPPPAPASTSGREDYDAAISISGMEPGEPFFLIKGHDVAASEAIRAYAHALFRREADHAMVESALQAADRIAAYPSKRLANTDHMTSPQVAQLRYQFGRRAQSASNAVEADVSLMLAETRAQQIIMSRLRSTLRDFFEGMRLEEDGRYSFDPESRRRGEAKEGLQPAPCPITALHLFFVSLGRELPPETQEAHLVRLRGILKELLELQRMKAREGYSDAYQRRKSRVWSEALAVLNQTSGGGIG